MAGTPEGKVKDLVKKLLKAHGAYAHWPVQAGYGSPTLDCNGSHHGMRFDIETKAPGKHLTPRQELIRTDLLAAGGPVFVIGEKKLGKKNYSGLRELHEWLSTTARAKR